MSSLGIHERFFVMACVGRKKMMQLARMHLFSCVRIALAGCLTSLINPNAQAAPYALMVYSDEMSAAGETEIETRLSFAKPRSSAVSTGLVTQTLTEISYGIAPGWAVGIEIPAVYSNSAKKLAGIAFEVQYVAPHDKSKGWYWGIRSEVGRVMSLYEDDTALSLELNPVIGFRGNHYQFVFNPSFDKPLSGKETSTQFHPSAKFSRRITATDDLGFEYYGYWGPASKLLAPDKRDEALYLVWDKRTFFGRLNMGLGQGVRLSYGSVDKWVTKVGIQFEID
jgi:hypothetical protein